MCHEDKDLVKIIAYLESRTSLTLCCTLDSQPYCCNCFYVIDKSKMVFYITSSLNTHHASIMLTSKNVAGTVHDQQRSVLQIKGVQYTGEITLLEQEQASIAREQFCRAYPVARLKKAPMWQIKINTLKMTDNTLGFGKKRHWARYD